MRLSPQAFNAHLDHMGQDVGWRPSYACPCTADDSGAARYDCPVCRGKGRTWGCETIGRAGMTNQTSKKGMADFGVWEAGDCLMTIGANSPVYACGRFDRIRSLNSTNVFSHTLIRSGAEALLGDIVKITRVFWLNDAGTAEVEGLPPDVLEDGTLSWQGGVGEPPAGKQYSITGVRYDEWFVYPEQPVDRNHHAGARLPRKLLVRRFDLFNR